MSVSKWLWIFNSSYGQMWSFECSSGHLQYYKEIAGGHEMTRSKKRLLSKHEDLSLNLRSQMKNLGMVASICNLALRKYRQEDLWSSLANWRRYPVLLNKVDGHLRTDTQSCSLVSALMETNACSHTHMNRYMHMHIRRHKEIIIIIYCFNYLKIIFIVYIKLETK